MDRGKNLWKRKPLEPAEKPKQKGWTSAKAASPVRILTPEEHNAALAKLGIKL